MKSNRPCILIYNPISGHGHLDSWNAMFVSLMLENGWRVLALTPDAPALMSRLAQKRTFDSTHLEVLDWNALTSRFNKQAALALLGQAWQRWNIFGGRYFYRRPGSETLPSMPFLTYWRTRLLQKTVPFLFRASHFIYARYRRRNEARTTTDSNIDPEIDYLDPPEFALRINAAIRKSKWKPIMVFNMYMDMYKTSEDAWNRFHALNRLHWAGIRFVPTEAPREGYYALLSLKGMCFLDEDICHTYQNRFPNKCFGYLPDITETALPDQPGELAREIRQLAAGRKVVFLGGSIGGQKNLARWYELITMADSRKWYFVQIGELHRGTLTTEDTAALEKVMSCLPENFLVKTEYLHDERAFNDIIRTVDVIFAVYRNFRISSNMLNKAAAFEKPILVADNYLMAERVRSYGIGKVAPQDDTALIYRALMSIDEVATLKDNFARYRKDFGIAALEINLARFIERCIANQFKGSL